MKYDYPAGVRWLGAQIFRLIGWKLVGQLPNLPKYIIVAAPHTSNWDGLLMLLYTATSGVRLRWLGKHTLFKRGNGWFLRLIGGVPVDRRARHNLVDQVAAEFAQRERLVIIITPEGTRKYTPHWRTGFYYMALQAGVPLVLAYADYPSKEVGIGPVLAPSGDIEADFAIIKAFYADKQGRHPEKAGTIALPPKDRA